jgi:hypothetical protein
MRINARRGRLAQRKPGPAVIEGSTSSGLILGLEAIFQLSRRARKRTQASSQSSQRCASGRNERSPAGARKSKSARGEKTCNSTPENRSGLRESGACGPAMQGSNTWRRTYDTAGRRLVRRRHVKRRNSHPARHRHPSNLRPRRRLAATTWIRMGS